MQVQKFFFFFGSKYKIQSSWFSYHYAVPVTIYAHGPKLISLYLYICQLPPLSHFVTTFMSGVAVLKKYTTQPQSQPKVILKNEIARDCVSIVSEISLKHVIGRE